MARKTDFEILLSIRKKLRSVMKSMPAGTDPTIFADLGNTLDDVGILLSRHTPSSRPGPRALPIAMRE